MYAKLRFVIAAIYRILKNEMLPITTQCCIKYGNGSKKEQKNKMQNFTSTLHPFPSHLCNKFCNLSKVFSDQIDGK